ncbi:hypothetical protein [Nocardia jiangsuensis]|uniref:Uncharacterized protein n=1 Tax=Nocardia jiangsuensis TaxID=1691563 RepID=A0ABV8E166_9NOCA
MWYGVRVSGWVAVEGFRYTPGWGSLGTITVGVLAVAVASFWNHRTLSRVEQRYQDDLREAHHDRVRDAILDVVHHTTMWALAFNEYRSLVQREVAANPSTQEEATAAEKRMRAASTESASTQNDLRRSLWSAQLVVDDEFVRQALDEVVELLGAREPERHLEWRDLPARLDEIHEKRVKITDVIDAVLDHAVTNLRKKVPAPCTAEAITAEAVSTQSVRSSTTPNRRPPTQRALHSLLMPTKTNGAPPHRTEQNCT